MIIKAIFLTFILVNIISCHTSKSVFSLQTSKKDILIFGSGGGFTGQVTKYYLTKDGKIYLQNAEVAEKAGNISKSVSAQIFANYIMLNLDKLELNEPGNKYYFIELTTPNKKTAIKWGKSPLENSNIDTYYKVLMNTVKTLKK